MDSTSTTGDASAPLVSNPPNPTEEVDFEPLAASDAAARLGGSATTDGGGMGGDGGGSQQQSQQGGGPALNRQGSLFERIQAAQAAQLGGGGNPNPGPGQEILPGADDSVPPFAQPPAPAPFAHDNDDDLDAGPTLYASALSVPQYQPVNTSNDPYGDPNNPMFANDSTYGGSAGEKATAALGAVWGFTTKYGGKAVRAGYAGAVGLVDKARGGGGGGGGVGGNDGDGLLGGGGGGANLDIDPPAPPGSAAGGGTTTAMEGMGGGGRDENYSMVAYARMFCSDVWGCLSAAPAPVQYALILMGCYLFWLLFK